VTGPRFAPLILAIAALAALAAACDSGRTPPASFLPGTVAAPREVNLIASDYAFVPEVVRVFPGETVLLHVVNAGLEPHEAVIGDGAVQAAWEEAEARTEGHPPGPTPVVSVPPDRAGVRVFVASGQRADMIWTVPVDIDGRASPAPGGWLVGCHIPGHFAKGMLVPIEFLAQIGGRGG
jgi:uncharacterized cupredoxin-like copper-binding protein